MRGREVLKRMRSGSPDAGVAMLTVVMAGAIMTGLGVAVTQTALVNLDNAGRDRVAGGAFGAAEAGVAGAITYIRGSGVRQICATCTTPWNASAPVVLNYPRGGQATVSIREVSPYNPPTVRVGTYVITSIGTLGAGPGKRTLEQTIEVRPFDFPLGIYTEGKLRLGGGVTVTQESIFSGSCVDSRDKLTFVAGPDGSIIDPYNNIPAAVHSTSYITNTANVTCSSNLDTVKTTDSGVIHRLSTCNSTWWADQDNTPLGGPFASPSGDFCRSKTTGFGDYDVKGSRFDAETMRDVYGYKPRGLTEDQYAILKAKARANGTYFPPGTASNSIVWPTASYNPTSPNYNPIIYIEEPSNTISLNNQLDSYKWVSDPGCTSLHPSVILVVERGELNLGSSASYTGNLFVPDGQVAFSGGASLLGTMYARDMRFIGNGSIGLNDCFAKNTSGGVLSIAKTHFREVDR